MSASSRKKNPAAKPAPKAPAPRPVRAQEVGLDEIKSLISLVAKEAFQEFEFEAGAMKFRIRKDSPHAPAPVVYAAPAPALAAPMPAAPMPAMPVPAAVPAAPAAPAEEAGLHYITSPIVGTFYRASNPNSPPFVGVGDTVRPGQTLCIVEAMKLMNEIECDVAGEVVKVLVENGQPVEYGERLFAVRVG
ncbi:MAG: acetyl-CoA carboxylase biotin carboxyl carrier protein [Holophagaceae bacterium]